MPNAGLFYTCLLVFFFLGGGGSAKISGLRSDQFCWEVVLNCGDTGFALQIIEFFLFFICISRFFQILVFWYYWCYYSHWSRDLLSPVC